MKPTTGRRPISPPHRRRNTATPARSSERAGNRTVSLDLQHQIILEHRVAAQKISRHLQRRWNFQLSTDESESITDLALCEAASRYRPTEGVTFTTYLFYFIKGALIRTLSARKEVSDNERSAVTIADDGKAWERSDEASSAEFDESSSNPERELYLQQLRAHCSNALSQLSELEREVVVQVHVLDGKVARVARALGYSRGHLSSVRTAAFKKIRDNFDDFRDAA